MGIDHESLGPSPVTGRKAIFLDRDGIVNQSIIRNGKPYPPDSLGEFIWVSGIRETLVELSARGYLLLIVTNQPDISRGTANLATVNAFHHRILSDLPIKKIYVCPHDDAALCSCRKPKPGLLLQGRDEFGIDMALSYMVGDRWRDVDAGNAAGCVSLFVDYAYEEDLKTKPAHVVKDVRQILGLIR